MLSRPITLFKLFGFAVRIDLSWLFLAVLIIWTLATGVFPATWPGQAPAVYGWMGVVGLFGLAASIVLHELAHALVARRYDMPIRGITLFIFGGIAEMQDEPASARGEFLMAIAGPILSLVLAGLFSLAAGTLGDTPTALGVVTGYLATINLVLAVFNLVPAYPLDGGRMLRAALWAWKGDILWATRIASALGALFGLLLIVLGLWAFVTGNVMAGLWWFLIGLFVRAASASALALTTARAVFAGQPVSRFMRRDPISVPPDLGIDDLVQNYVYRHYFKSFPVTGADNRLIGCITVDAVKQADRDQWPILTVRDLMAPCGTENTITPEAEATEALAQMRRTGHSRLIVSRGGQLIGIVALRDLLEYLSLSADLGAESRRGDDHWGKRLSHG